MKSVPTGDKGGGRFYLYLIDNAMEKGYFETNFMVKQQIGKRLRDLRHRKGLTQKALAKMTEVDYSYIGKIERGEQFPSLKVLVKFAECLSLPIDRFFMDEATFRLVSLIPPDIRAATQRERLWDLLKLLERVPEEDIPLLTEIIRVLKKHGEMRNIEKEELPLVAESSAGYKKIKKKG
ncbi:MAG: helix-turn-helix transcriptional regulator [Deltaproteobacteria bacterium]|nr:helix-turn-helix transcriptional regulator [Deltaproteobacteria bacterium]